MDAFAIHNEVQYQPASSIAPAERLLVVVPGALRNSDLYVAHAQAAGADQTSTLIVAPQFLGDVDVRGRQVPPQTLYWDVAGWKLAGCSSTAMRR